MSPEEHQTIIRRYLDEAWNKGNVDIIDELMAPNYARYMGTATPLNREGQKQRILGFRRGFPDLHLTLEDIFATGDRVGFRMLLRGTHQGEFMRIAPTSKRVEVVAIDMARFVDGKVVDQWGQTDTLGLLQQLGATISVG